MDYCQNFSFPGDLHSDCLKQEQLLDNTVEDLFSTHCPDGGDVSLEWLSVFMEDCLTSPGNCLPPAPASSPRSTSTSSTSKKERTTHMQNKKSQSQFLHKFVIPGKARSKRKRTPLLKNTTFFNSWPHHNHHKTQLEVLVPSLDPPLLQQAYWLADSELMIMPESKKSNIEEKKMVGLEDNNNNNNNGQLQQGRKCSHCLVQKTPQWRAGPLGPKTLCNACGVRYKSGRLFPEYRPAKSPTFVSYKHSNSHKKVLEMRSSNMASTM